MPKSYTWFKILFINICCVLGAVQDSYAQTLLNKTIRLDVNKRPLGDVLNSISKQGDFYFSYNSKLIPQEKIVSVTSHGKTVRQLLDELLGNTYQYRERDNYIIIQDGDIYTISGYVVDRSTGSRIGYASVYEKQQLTSTLTNEQGFFKLKLKDKDAAATATIAVSKGMYADTTLVLRTGYDQELTLAIRPMDYTLDSIVIKPRAEKNWLGGLFLSSRQKFQSMNIGNFIASRPVQTSFVPGLGTHGKISGQVVNKFSLNILGGYTAGARGVEIGGLFNIDKGDVQFLQIGGIFNVVGGKVKGVQIGGLYNSALDSMRGAQVAGISSITNGSVEGLQISGIYGMATDYVDGVQIAGLVNVAGDSVSGLQVSGVGNVSPEVNGVQIGGVYNYTKTLKGVQVSGLGNISGRKTEGTQVSGLYNYTGHLQGTQIGIVNIADSSDGYSIGIFNFVWKNGYHKLSFSNNEVLNLNASFKMGNHKLYSILMAGINLEANKRAYGMGFGMGADSRLTKKLSLSTEATVQYFYLGDWDESPYMIRFEPALHYNVGKMFSVFAGPAVSLYYHQYTTSVPGYKSDMPGYANYSANQHFSAWFGWTVGVNIL